MPAPALDLRHLKTSRQRENGFLIRRYWFEWQNRRQLDRLVIRIELLSAIGTVLTDASFRLPKTRITGYVPDEPKRSIYDGSVWLQLDDIDRVDEPPAIARYYTITGLNKKSETVDLALSGIFDDLSMLP